MKFQNEKNMQYLDASDIGLGAVLIQVGEGTVHVMKAQKI